MQKNEFGGYGKKMNVTKSRSALKAITWRILGSIDTFIVSYIITGHAKWALGIAGTEAITKLILYYFHERIWNKIQWGRNETLQK